MGRSGRHPLGRSGAWILLAVAVVLTGCSVHHYHHYDPAPSPAAITVARPRPEVPWAEVVPAAHATAAPTPLAPPTATSVKQTPTNESPIWRRVSGAGLPVDVRLVAGGPEPPGTGAASAPPPAQPLPAPAKLPAAAEPGDRRAARLTLDQVINAVLVSDPKLRAGFEAINQASADALGASLRPNPTLYLDIQLLPLTRPFTPDATGGPPQQDVNLTYPIDWYVFGKRAANMAAAAQGVRVSEADFADRVRIRVTDAVATYYDVLEARALLDLAGENVALLEQVEAALAKAVAAGGRPRVELGRVRLDLLQGRQAVRDAETTLVSGKARLRALIGRSDRDPEFDIDGTLDVPLVAHPPPPDEGFEIAARNRPDVQAARLRGAQARANAEAERRKAYPDVAPMFGYTRQYQARAIGQPDANSWTAAVTMSLPVYNRNQGGRARAASVVAQTELDYQAALTDLRAEVETAAQQLAAARANAEAAAGDQLRLARDLLRSVTAAYQAGGRPLLDLLDAQRNFRDTYRTYVTVRAAYWRAVYRYAAALGQKITP